MSGLIIVSATKESEGRNTLLNISQPHAVRFNCNNTKGLAEIYNQYIHKDYKDYTLVMAHDDLYIDDLRLEEKVNKALKVYDVVGLAGTIGPLNIKPPALWHIMGGPRENYRGSVAHFKEKGNTKQLFSTSFGLTPDRVLLIDGLFMAVKVQTLLDNNIRFDETNPARFHFYDLDFCLQCNKAKLKIGVWPIWCVHASPGLQEYSQEFLMGQEWFIKKWGNT